MFKRDTDSKNKRYQQIMWIHASEKYFRKGILINIAILNIFQGITSSGVRTAFYVTGFNNKHMEWSTILGKNSKTK